MQKVWYLEIFYYQSYNLPFYTPHRSDRKLNFSTRLAVELKQFLPDRLEISTVSVRLNYLQKFFVICWKLFELQGIFRDFFFQNAAIFLKINNSKRFTYIFRYFHIKNKEVRFLLRIGNFGTYAASSRPMWKKCFFFPAGIPCKKTSLGESLGETFCAKESHQESCRESRIGSYAWLSARLSPRLVCLRGITASFFNIIT